MYEAEPISDALNPNRHWQMVVESEEDSFLSPPFFYPWVFLPYQLLVLCTANHGKMIFFVKSQCWNNFYSSWFLVLDLYLDSEVDFKIKKAILQNEKLVGSLQFSSVVHCTRLEDSEMTMWECKKIFFRWENALDSHCRKNLRKMWKVKLWASLQFLQFPWKYLITSPKTLKWPTRPI